MGLPIPPLSYRQILLPISGTPICPVGVPYWMWGSPRAVPQFMAQEVVFADEPEGYTGWTESIEVN